MRSAVAAASGASTSAMARPAASRNMAPIRRSSADVTGSASQIHFVPADVHPDFGHPGPARVERLHDVDGVVSKA